jgi:acetyltransferase-like isoleucine patch superfamily enzyme
MTPRFKVLSWINLKWIVNNRAWSRYYLVRYFRFIRVHYFGSRSVVLTGFVFLGKGVELSARKGYGKVVIGPWVHLGDNNRIRAHEGTVTIGRKTVLGRDNTINAFLNISIGSECILSDSIYVCDFDHRITSIDTAIRNQGIIKSPVIIGSDIWIGTKVSVLRGSFLGDGCVVGANSVVKGSYKPLSVVAGVPAKVIRMRDNIDRETIQILEHQAYVKANEEAALNLAARADLGNENETELGRERRHHQQ